MVAHFINETDDTPEAERVESFRGGMDAYSRAAMLPPITSQLLINCLVADNDIVGTRPGADAIGGAVLDAGDPVKAMCYFDTPSTELLLASINLTVRKWDGAGPNWATLAAYPFGANNVVEMLQGNNVVYCSSGSGQWYSTDGTTWTGLGVVNTGTAGDPPNGATIMAWHTFRMFASGNFASSNDTIYVSTIGDAGAGQWNYATFSFRVGRGEGEAITAMCSATGDWLAVAKEASVYLVQTDPLATTAAAWRIIRIAGAVGCVGKRAMLSFVDFILVFGEDGLRRINPTDHENMPWEVSPPLSEPMQPYIDRINKAHRSKIVLHKYRHWCFVCLPLDSATEPSHVLVWNTRTGAWMGVFTGWTPTVLCNTRFASVGDRLAIGDSAGYVNQWKDRDDLDDEDTYTDNAVAIATEITTRSFLFGMPHNQKDGTWLEVRFVDTPGMVSIQAIYDGAGVATLQQSAANPLNQLPVNLPFDLAITTPKRLLKNLDGLGEFNEAWLVISATSGRVNVKNASMCAFYNTVKTE